MIIKHNILTNKKTSSKLSPMRTHLAILMILCTSSWANAGERQWTPVKSQPPEVNIRLVEAHPRDPRTWFAGTDSAVYRTIDAGETWSSVLSLRGSDQKIYDLFTDPATPDIIYACTSKGIRRSVDGGKRWKAFFKPLASDAQDIYCLIADEGNSHNLWAGTADGLYTIEKTTGRARRVDALPAKKIYSLASGLKGELFVRTDKGMFRGLNEDWRQVIFDIRGEKEQEVPLRQFAIEEMVRPSIPFNIVYAKTSDIHVTAMRDGLYASSKAGDWKRLDGAALDAQRIRRFAASTEAIYTATDRGVYRLDNKSKEMKTFSSGLDSTDIRWVTYSGQGDFLLAATSAGIFRLPHPDLKIEPVSGEIPPSAAEFLNRFANEPSISAVQAAAVRYAEVHPDKIAGWRRAAARKALLPTLSFDTDLDKDRNVDVDRGGTGDPDRFIVGPEEESFAWSFDVSWNLGELIWNDDQTSIDSRSKLMVELREDILNQVTHLYYERRRLQAEIALSPTGDLAVQIEKDLRLQELTAQLDALTGGFLTGGQAYGRHDDSKRRG